MNFIVVAELLQMRDAFSIGRAERRLLDYLHAMFRWGICASDLGKCFLYLARIEWIRKNYDLCLGYLGKVIASAPYAADNDSLAHAHLGVAHVYTQIGELQAAQEAAIDAVAASKYCSYPVREEIRAGVNLVFNELCKQRRK